jgi:hypothetical protein
MDFSPASGLKAAVALACLLTGCVYEVRPEQPPQDVSRRQQAEVRACWNGVLPAWLDDSALGGSARLDRREAQASGVNDSFRGATFSPQPPTTPRPGSRVATLLGERRAFQQRCALLRSGGKDLGPQ